jgi:predicted AAA+ superfamily ATPase
MAAGSLLGITLLHKTSFPVGKVDSLTLFPMSFNEFLMALGQEQLFELLNSNDWPMILKAL